MVGLTPNFNFNEHCREAVELYREAFGAEVRCLLCYADAAPEDLPRPLREEEKTYVYHSELRIAGQRVIMADQLELEVRPAVFLM